jgi:hypothetical protein
MLSNFWHINPYILLSIHRHFGGKLWGEVRLLYDWRSVIVLVSSTLVGLATRYYFLSECCCLKFPLLFLWDTLSDERSAICSVITQWSESRRTRNHTLLPHLGLLQTWRAWFPYFHPPGTGWPSYIPGLIYCLQCRRVRYEGSRRN